MTRRRPQSCPASRKGVAVVVAEGVSEKVYLDRIRSRFDGMPVRTVDARGGDMKRLVKECEKVLSDKGAWDLVAVATDVDEKSPEDIAKLKAWCDDNGVELYLSNPSFEVFLLMHYEDAGGASQDDLESSLTRHLGRKYHKSRGIAVTDASVKAAVERGETSISGAGDPVGRIAVMPGTTNFQRLVRKIVGGKRLRRPSDALGIVPFRESARAGLLLQGRRVMLVCLRLGIFITILRIRHGKRRLRWFRRGSWGFPLRVR